MTSSSDSIVLSSLVVVEFESSNIASDVVGGGLVDTLFDVVGRVVVVSSVMLSSLTVVVGGTEDDGVMGGERG